MSSRTVEVPNISCGHCVRTIEREVGGIDGVKAVRAREDTREVRVEWDEARTSWESIRALLVDIDYPPVG